jgi:hypothetical protein
VSIQDKVNNSLKHFFSGDISNSLEQCMIASDASARKMYKTLGNRERMEKFFSEYMEIITGVGIRMIVAKGISLGSVQNETESLESILYKYIRCNLLHEAEISDKIIFSENTFGSVDDKFTFPKTLPVGICFAVIACPNNSSLWIRNPVGFNYLGKNINLNLLWGRKNLIKKIFGISI